jgi:hypothetical protein
MKFNWPRYFGLVMLLTVSLPGLWWRAAHSELTDSPKTTFLLIWTVFNIFLICWDQVKGKE